MNKYRPSNGTEGMWFSEKFCDVCIKDQFETGGESCDIMLNAFLYSANEPGFPSEWTYDEKNEPTCTAFQDESKIPEPGPNQIKF